MKAKTFLLILLFFPLAVFSAESTNKSETNAEQPPSWTIGVRTNLLYDLKNWNVHVDFPVFKFLTVGPSFFYMKGTGSTQAWDTSNPTVLLVNEEKLSSQAAFGVQAGIHFSGEANKGLILSPFVYVAPSNYRLNNKITGEAFENSYLSFMAGALLSYGFSLDMLVVGLNTRLGMGVMYAPSQEVALKKIGDPSTTRNVTAPSELGGWIPMFEVGVGLTI